MRLTWFVLLFTAVAVLAQPTDPASSPVGGWIADHKAGETLQLWWHFFPDSTVYVTAGQVTRTRYTLRGNTLTLAPSAPTGQPTLARIQLSRESVTPSDKIWPIDHLALSTPGSGSPVLYDKLPTDGPTLPLSLIGCWRLRTPPESPHNLAPLLIFRADGTTETRLPLKVMRGTWKSGTANPFAGLYSLPNNIALPFSRVSASLELTLPPDGKDRRLYHHDDFPYSP